MDVDITITNRQRKYPLNTKKMRSWARAILAAQDEADVTVGLVFVGDRVMRRFNRQYRGVDAPTDVLAFPMDSPGTLLSLEKGYPKRHCGDLMISLERADAEASLFYRNFSEHLFCLIAHGLLHLLGYDHERSRQDAVKMQRREKKLFATCYQGS